MPSLSPVRAARFVQKPSRSQDRVPALIWLTLAIGALIIVRQKAWPTASQAGTLVVGLLVVVFLGSVAPRIVFWLLLALLVAATLGAAPQIIAGLEYGRTKVQSLAPAA